MTRKEERPAAPKNIDPCANQIEGEEPEAETLDAPSPSSRRDLHLETGRLGQFAKQHSFAVVGIFCGILAGFKQEIPIPGIALVLVAFCLLGGAVVHRFMVSGQGPQRFLPVFLTLMVTGLGSWGVAATLGAWSSQADRVEIPVLEPVKPKVTLEVNEVTDGGIWAMDIRAVLHFDTSVVLKAEEWESRVMVGLWNGAKPPVLGGQHVVEMGPARATKDNVLQVVRRVSLDKVFRNVVQLGVVRIRVEFRGPGTDGGPAGQETVVMLELDKSIGFSATFGESFARTVRSMRFVDHISRRAGTSFLRSAITRTKSPGRSRVARVEFQQRFPKDGALDVFVTVVGRSIESERAKDELESPPSIALVFGEQFSATFADGGPRQSSVTLAKGEDDLYSGSSGPREMAVAQNPIFQEGQRVVLKVSRRFQEGAMVVSLYRVIEGGAVLLNSFSSPARSKQTWKKSITITYLSYGGVVELHEVGIVVPKSS